MPKILIIEDEAAIRRVLSKIISEENDTYEVEEAEDGLEGVEMVLKSDFDLVLCDIKMPKMDGVEVLEKIKKAKPEIPVIMISGHANIKIAVDSIKLGAFEFLEKPFNKDRLLNFVNRALENSSLKKE